MKMLLKVRRIYREDIGTKSILIAIENMDKYEEDAE